MNKLNKFLVVIILLTNSFIGLSQSSTNSPYTYFGIGEFELSDHSRISGIGGTGIGLKSTGFINYLNPASYSNIDSLNFIFDIALSGSYSKFESTSNAYNTLTGNLKKIGFGFRLHPLWAMSLGIVPYTNVGYKTNILKGIEGSTDFFNIASEGKGGLSKVFWGNSFKVGKHISLGVNSNILIGYYEKSETYTYENLASGYWQTKKKFEPNTAICFDFGMQFTDSLNSKWEYTVGVIGGLNTKLKMIEYITYESDSSATADQYTTNSDFWIPAYGGVGFSINSSKWMFAADYKVQYWNNVTNKNEMPWLNNSHHFAVGAQYTPKGHMGKTVFERMTYQVGAHFDRSYLTIGAENYDIYGASVGVLIPIRNQMSSIGISVDAGKKGRLSSGMFKENYIQVNLSLNLSDIWFQKRRFN